MKNKMPILERLLVAAPILAFGIFYWVSNDLIDSLIMTFAISLMIIGVRLYQIRRKK